MYTLATLKHLCRQHNIPVVDERKADALWVSMCDPCDLPALKKARDRAGHRPVIMGGFESYFGNPYLAWADAVVVGEGLEFIQAWSRDANEAMSMPCVLQSPDQVVIPSYRVPYSKVPLLKVPGNERYYYLAGRGCKRKCRFCATSWVQPHTVAPQGALLNTVKYLESRGKAKLTLITNDSEGLIESSIVNAQSVRIESYLSDPAKYKACMLHFGVEGWTEQTRRLFSKPISNDSLRALLNVTKAQKQKCELFFLVGYAGWTMEDVRRFADEVVDLDTSNSPTIHIKITYIDPCPHTPMAKDAVNPAYCDVRSIFAELNSRNKRIRVWPTRSAARSAWRTAIHRCDPNEAVRLGNEPRDTNSAESFEIFRDNLSGKGLAHLLAEQDNAPCENIKVRCK